jgi:O-antigen/teichoic acid export membrane protein
LYWIVSTSDRWFISAYLDHKSVGIYAFSCSIAYIGQMLNSAFLSAWRTESFRTFEQSPSVAQEVLGRLWSRFAVMLGLVWLAIAAAGGDIIRLLSRGDFHDGAMFVPWLAGAVFFYGVAHLANTGLLLGKNMRPWTVCWIAGAISSLGLNLFFVRRFGALGAAMVQMISFAIIAIGVTLVSQKTYPLKIHFRKLLTVGLAVGATGLSMSIAWHSAPLVSLALKFPVGLIAAAAASYYIAPDWLTSALRRISG